MDASWCIFFPEGISVVVTLPLAGKCMYHIGIRRCLIWLFPDNAIDYIYHADN